MPRARNTSTSPEAQAIDEATKAFTRVEAQYERLRAELHAAIVAAVRAGVSKAEAGRRGGYSREYVTALVKDADQRDDT